MDLSAPELKARVLGKARKFEVIADALIRNKLVGTAILVAPDSCIVVARAYWLLNQAFKNQLLADGVKTNACKRAGIQACAIMAIRPFSPADPANVAGVMESFANPVFGLHAGNAVIGAPKLRPSTDELRRFFSNLLSLRFSCLANFLKNANADVEDQEIYEIELSPGEIQDMILSSISLKQWRGRGLTHSKGTEWPPSLERYPMII